MSRVVYVTESKNTSAGYPYVFGGGRPTAGERGELIAIDGTNPLRAIFEGVIPKRDAEGRTTIQWDT